MSWELLNIDTKGVTSGQIKTLCPQCSADRRKNTEPCLSINLDEGVYNCHNCGWNGGIDETPGIPEHAEKYIPDSIVAFFADRNISKATLDKAGIYFYKHWMPATSQTEGCMVFPYYKHKKLVNRKYRDKEKNFALEKNAELCLWNFDAIKDTENIIVTEGEIDALSVMEAGVYTVCSVPNGASKNQKLEFLKSAEPLFKKAKRIFLALDKDEAGIMLEEKIVEYFGEDKMYNVRYPEGLKDMNEVLVKYGKEMVKTCLQSASHLPLKGIRSFREFIPEIEDYYENGLKKAFATGFGPLDLYFKLQPGALNVVTGIPMSGKSEFIDAIMINTITMHRWKWAVYSPENMPVAFHFQKLAEKMTQLPMFGATRMSRDDLKSSIAYANENIKLIMGEDEALPIKTILLKIRVCIEMFGIKAVIIDPYNEIDHQLNPGETEKQYISRFLSIVRNFARKHGIVLFLIAHPTKLKKREDGEYPIPTPYDISGASEWRDKADNCIALWRKFNGNEQEKNRVLVCIQKVRNKNIGQTGVVEFEWNYMNGIFTPVEHPVLKAD